MVVYNIFFLMLLWSFFKTMYSDPGQVPTFWGFHLGDNESKRRRYCLICNVFKPDRCHHCSTCNRCVLNMDHHCPWVNNCIGFWNRKFFLLLLIYGLLLSYMTLASLATDFYYFSTGDDPRYKFESKEKDAIYKHKKLCVLIGFTLNFIITVLLTGFFKFHLRLAVSNKTTIENLEQEGRPFQSKWDIGTSGNIRQIFGANKWLYPFPAFWATGKPVGDGIYWQTMQNINIR